MSSCATTYHLAEASHLDVRSRVSGSRVAAPKVQAHVALHMRAEGDADASPDGLPDAAAIETIIDAVFWASLRQEEEYVPRLSLALLSPGRTTQPLLFESPLSLVPSTLVHLAAAVERPGIHLGVWNQGGELKVWGTTKAIPRFSFVLEVAAPGLLVAKHHRDGVGKFVNVAVLEGDQIKIIDERASRRPECAALLTSLLGFETPERWTGAPDILVQLPVSMREHGPGGSLLMVPHGSQAWRESVVYPMTYLVQPGFAELADLVKETPSEQGPSTWQDTLREAVGAVAGLTAVDGATIVNDSYEVLTFGAKITRRSGFGPSEGVSVTEPIEGSVGITVHPTRLGGTRHLSAAQFVHDQHDALAMVASQVGGSPSSPGQPTMRSCVPIESKPCCFKNPKDPVWGRLV